MHFTIRNAPVVTISKAAAALLIATSFGAGTATADDSWKLTVNNTGSAPLKVIILDTTSKDITGDRSAEYKMPDHDQNGSKAFPVQTAPSCITFGKW